jgi:hypothetical protein
MYQIQDRLCSISSGKTRQVDSALLVRDRDLWALALLAAAVSCRELGFGPFVHHPREARRPVNDFPFGHS